MPARPFGIGHEAKSLDDDRILTFQQLRRHRTVTTSHHHWLSSIDTIHLRPATPAPEEHVHKGEIPTFAMAVEVQHVGALPDSAQPSWQGLGNGAKNHVAQGHHERSATTHRS